MRSGVNVWRSSVVEREKKSEDLIAFFMCWDFAGFSSNRSKISFVVNYVIPVLFRLLYLSFKLMK